MTDQERGLGQHRDVVGGSRLALVAVNDPDPCLVPAQVDRVPPQAIAAVGTFYLAERGLTHEQAGLRLQAPELNLAQRVLKHCEA